MMTTTNSNDTTNMVNAIVRLGNQKVNIVNLTIEQEYGQHHRFEVELDYDMLGNTFMQDPTTHIEHIGRIVTIDLQQGNNNGSAYVFKGIVTQVKMTGKDGRNGYLILEGNSTSIMLDRGKRMDIYSDMTLRNIFKNLIEGVYSDYMQFVNEPTFENKIDFLMQYNESDWEFLQRIAYLYGENLFYSGSEILFGAYEEWEAIKLTYDKEIADIQFCSRMLPNQSIFYQYSAEQDTLLEKQSPDKIEDSNAYLDATDEQNQALTSGKPAKNIIPANITGRGEIDELSKRNKTRTASQTVFITGKAKTYSPSIGRLITISMPEMMGSKELGTYRVVKSIHRIDERLQYSNEFEAVPASLQTMPVKEPKMPVAESVMGKVSSNEDPKGLGRVQVDFSFANQYSKVWMRVLTPNAGSSEEVQQNRGLVFIPEKGDQVMVGFEYGDPNRPYVLGSLFHGKNAKGGDTDNHIKSIITRSGHTIEFNDADSSLGVNIFDKEKNVIRINTKENKIEISANEEIVLESKIITLNASEKLNFFGASISEHSREHEILTEGTFKVEANEQNLKSNNYNQSSTGGSKIISGGTVDIKGSTINLDMGGNAPSPKAPAEARNMVTFSPAPKNMLESEILADDTNVEQPGESPQIVEITLFDNDGNETEYLSRSTYVEVQTKDMAGQKVELILEDKETGDNIHFGDYFVPKNEYVIKTNVRKQERHKTEE